MTVSELIAFLQTQPQDISVAFALYSEYTMLEFSDITVEELCEARPE